MIYVDALVLDSSGNLFDCLSIATKAALHNTRIPKITIVETESGETEIELSDDPADTVRLDVSNVPLSVTMALVGQKFIADPSLDEELCMDARLTVAVNPKANICAIQKGGIHGALSPSVLFEMIQAARKIGLALSQKLDLLLLSEENPAAVSNPNPPPSKKNKTLGDQKQSEPKKHGFFGN